MNAAARRAAWAEEHRAAIPGLAGRLEAGFDGLRERAALDPALLAARPPGGGWSGALVLEHVGLMDRFVFVLVEKIAGRTRARLARGEPWPRSAPGLEVVARAALAPRVWPHPLHMTPTGTSTPAESAAVLAGDRARALAWLLEFPSGEGTLHRIRMSRVEGDGRLDLYQFLELVARHAERHAAQIDRALAQARGA